jgi:hypothetical protein
VPSAPGTRILVLGGPAALLMIAGAAGAVAALHGIVGNTQPQ